MLPRISPVGVTRTPSGWVINSIERKRNTTREGSNLPPMNHPMPSWSPARLRWRYVIILIQAHPIHWTGRAWQIADSTDYAQPTPDLQPRGRRVPPLEGSLLGIDRGSWRVRNSWWKGSTTCENTLLIRHCDPVRARDTRNIAWRLQVV